MKMERTLFGAFLLMLLFSTMAAASDFDWVKDFNIRAEADWSDFKASLTERFQIGDAQVSTVVSEVQSPSDAYIVLRLAEMLKLPPARVMTEYKSGKGWGVIARNLGIKPGSPEFHELKSGQNLYVDYYKDKGKSEEKSKGKSKGKSKK